MNRKLTSLLLILIIVLLLLIGVAYIKNNKSPDNTGSGNKNISEEAYNEEIKKSGDLSGDAPGSADTKDPSNPDKVTEDDTLVTGDTSGELSGNEDANNTENSNNIKPSSEPIVLAFAGDVNLDEESKPVARYDREKKGILGGISKELVDEMNNADIFMLNNEFAYSTRGARIKEKSYTFRAHPKRVEILKEMGADIVSLANNHALDWGVDALLDTFTTLEEAGIDYVGAGRNIDRAKEPVYYTIGDTTIAFVAASRVIYAVDWYATDNRPGMIGTYDPALFLETIKEAKANSDYVVAYVHWGVERTNEPVEYQKQLAKAYIDAGADAVIGCHPHVMQGIEFYKGKPIAYSLGNYWFNASTKESGLLKIYLNSDGTTDVQLLPAMNKNTYTYLITGEKEKKAYYRFMEDISFDVKFDEDGYVKDTKIEG